MGSERIMYRQRKIVLRGLLCVLLVLPVSHAFAQHTVMEGRQFAAEKNYDKAIPVFEEIYGLSPDSVYKEYLDMLLLAKKYKQAEKLVERQISFNSQNYILRIDLGNVYLKQGKEAQAKEQFNMLVGMVNGDDMLTTRIVGAFTDAGKYDYAAATYERAIEILHSAYIYSAPLAKLYALSGKLDKGLDMLFAPGGTQFMTADGVKSLLLELLGNDPAKLQVAQKALIRKINEQPENVYYVELLTWIYTQKNDWDGALIQIEAIDERNRELGKRLMEFARTAVRAGQYEIAAKAYDDIIIQGKEVPNYMLARTEKLAASMTRLKKDPDFKPADVKGLVVLYDSFMTEFPAYYATATAADYAMLVAQYGNDVPRGIKILQKGIANPNTRRDMAGKFKLQLGDYYLLIGRRWDASLTYSQVDKDFKEDMMGEDARFRNSKLAYYHGDFDLAQKELSILKASTSELIANDAIYLSVLITENVEDSNLVPLQRFAYADLLLFQNKDAEAETLLDSLNKAFPKHPLNDDILMQRAEIALKHKDYTKALSYLKTINEQFGQDVLGDDAVFMMADIYQTNLHQVDLAKTLYEQLIIDYQGSTYVQTARQRLSEINNGANP